MEFISIRRDELDEFGSIGREDAYVEDEVGVRSKEICHHYQERQPIEEFSEILMISLSKIPSNAEKHEK